MSTRSYKDYTTPALADYYIANNVTVNGDNAIINGAIANYAETRRNVCCYTANTTGVITCNSQDSETWNYWISVPIGGRVIRPGTLKVWLLYTTSSELAANNVRWIASVGEVSSEGDIISVAKAWASVTLDLPAGPSTSEDMLTIKFQTEGANTLTVYSCCAYQTEESSTTMPDFSNAASLIADIDYPISAAQYQLLRNSVVAVRDRRTIKSNVYAHWYRDFHKTGAAYGADDDDLGAYKLVKRAGVDKMYVHGLFTTDDKVNAATFKATMSDTVEGSVTVSFTEAATDDPRWDTFVFTFAGADITDEVELTLTFDALDGGNAIDMMMLAVCVTEEHIDTGGAIAHTVPDLDNIPVGSVVGASEWDNVKTSQTVLWEQSGQAIALGDYRFGSTDVSYDERLYLEATARDKDDHGYDDTSIACRMVTYSSKNSKRLRVSMGYITNDANSDHLKTIETQLSDNIAAGTFDEQGPLNDATFIFSRANNEVAKTMRWDVTIPAGDQETPAADLTPGTEPMQVWIFGSTANAAEYIKPLWVSVEELSLSRVEFP